MTISVSKVLLAGCVVFLTVVSGFSQTKKKYVPYRENRYVDTVRMGDTTVIMPRKELRKSAREMIGSQEMVVYNGDTLSGKVLRQTLLKSKRDSVRSHKKVWVSILGGPSYTPEASVGVGGAALISFKMNQKDSVSFRSFLPVGFNITLNGTFVAAGAGKLYMKENRFRIYTDYGYRNDPANFYGIGYDQIDANIDRFPKIKDSTSYRKQEFYLNPDILFQVAKGLFIGPIVSFRWTKLQKLKPWMEQDEYVKKFKRTYVDVGLGATVQYDTRDDGSTPYNGIWLVGKTTFYGKYFGGSYNFNYTSIDYRQYQQLFHRRSVLAWNVRTDFSSGDVPFTKLPTFGSPFDLRGYLMGKFRDKTMAYALVEYRHMFGTEASYKRGTFGSRLGAVGWVGTGTIGSGIKEWNRWKFNYGVGLRYEIQPRKNFRIDIGREVGGKSGKGAWLFYLNMTEAF